MFSKFVLRHSSSPSSWPQLCCWGWHRTHNSCHSFPSLPPLPQTIPLSPPITASHSACPLSHSPSPKPSFTHWGLLHPWLNLPHTFPHLLSPVFQQSPLVNKGSSQAEPLHVSSSRLAPHPSDAHRSLSPHSSGPHPAPGAQQQQWRSHGCGACWPGRHRHQSAGAALWR